MTLLERLGGREAITRGIVHLPHPLPPPRPSRHEEAAGEELDAYLRGAGPLPRPGRGGQPDGRRAPPRRAGDAPPPDPPGPPGHGVRRPAGQRLEPLTDPVTVVEEGGFLPLGRPLLPGGGQPPGQRGGAVAPVHRGGEPRAPAPALHHRRGGGAGGGQGGGARLAGRGRNTCSTPTAFTWAGRWWARPAEGGRPGPPAGRRAGPGAPRLEAHPLRRPGRPLRRRHQPGPGQPDQAAGRLSGRAARRADRLPLRGPDPQRHPRPGRGSGILPRGARPLPPAGRPGATGRPIRPDRGLRPGGGAGRAWTPAFQAHALAF